MISFDIFDTLITRNTAIPSGIFSLMQNEIQKDDFPKYLKQNFCELRIKAETYLRSNQNKREIKFSDIYKLIGLDYALSEKQINFLQNLEIQTEIKNIIPISENIEKLKNFLSKNKKVILISDMYHCEKTIRKMLCCVSDVFLKIPIYVSSKYDATKSQGKLFEIVGQEESIEYAEWLHIGDNVISDFKVPKKLGIKTELYNYVKLKPYEKNLLQKFSNCPYIQLSVGISKNIRLFYCKNDKFMQMGVSFASPILALYIFWLLEQAEYQKLKHLYFISRGGYILKNIADKVIFEFGLPIKTHYIYGSRIAWKNPNDKNLLIEYLKQEIDFSKDNFAFVDDNGTGETCENLNAIVKEFYSPPLKIFFCNTLGDILKKEVKISSMRISLFLFNEFELLLKAPHGTSLGYKKENNKIMPIFEDKEKIFFNSNEYQNYVLGLEYYVDKFLETLKSNNIREINSLLFNEYYNYIYKPDRELADQIGRIPYSDISTNHKSAEYAPKSAIKILCRKTCNREISLARTNIFVKIILSALIQFVRKLKGGYNQSIRFNF